MDLKKCKTCKTPSPTVNLFDDECVDCMVSYAIFKVDRIKWDFDVNCKVPEFKDPLHSLGGFVFDVKEPF